MSLLVTRLTFACALMMASLPSFALQQPAPAATSAISPAQARRAVVVLEDDRKRAETLQTLKAIASAAPAASTTVATPAASAPAASGSAAAPASSSSSAAVAATPAATPAAQAPLEADGLIARMLRDIGHWVDGLGDQLSQVKVAALALPSLLGRALSSLATGANHGLVLKLLAVLAGVFALGLALEWLLYRILRRPRAALLAHADAADIAEIAALRKHEADVAAQAEAQRRAAEAAARAPQGAGASVAATAGPVPAVDSAAVDLTPGRGPAAPVADAAVTAPATAAATAAVAMSPADAAAADAPPASTPPANNNVAMVVTHKDGVEQVEAVPVAAGDGGSGGGSNGGQAAPTSPHSAAKDAKDARPDSSGAHLRTLRHLPYAFATLVLDIIPIALFFVAAGMLLRALAGDESRTFNVVSGFIDAYVTTRAGMAVLRVLVSPVGHGLRLLKMSRDTALAVMNWGRRILVIGAFGIAIADAIELLGGGMAERRALIKLVSLVLHICVIILIFRVKRPVSRHIAAPREATGPVASARNWVADIWAYAAAVLVMGLWFIWALGVEDGFQKLLHFVGVTAAVIVATRVISVIVLGAVGRFFAPVATEGADAPQGSQVDVHRYYPLARAVVTLVMGAAMVVALLQVWGVDALAWFAAGTLGRSVASAGLTILVAAVVAIVVWEFANARVNRRLVRWTDQGEVVRAARLRTLLPMLRTCLLVIMVLIVGLTALSQIGVNTTPLLAGASIIGVALGFGSQKLVQDFITGIFLLLENAMQVGDTVTVAGVSGSVEYLSIRTVRIRGGDGSLYIVPFSSVTTVNNTNRGLGNAALRISLGYEVDVGQAIDELKKLGAEMRSDETYQDLILADIEVWGVDAVDGSMFTLAGQMRCTDKGRWGVQRELNKRILERFRSLGIEVANPDKRLVVSESVPRIEQQATAPQAPGS